MDIKKEFELLFEVPDFLDFDGEAYMYYGEDPLLEETWQDIHANWVGFQKGCKSRDKEISFLRKQLKICMSALQRETSRIPNYDITDTVMWDQFQFALNYTEDGD